MEKIICSLEEWDSILNYHRPNGSSKTWYIKELKKLSRPLMWGDWDIFNEDGEMFSQDFFKGKISPSTYYKNIEYVNLNDSNNSKHIYIINIYNMSFFNDNYDIGFKCVSEKYLNDVRNGKSKILLMLILEGYSGSQNNQDLDIIEKWRNDSNLPEKSIYYGCGNQLISGPYKGINVVSILDFESWNLFKYDDCVNYNPCDEKNLFLVYNRNPRPHRVKFCISLIKEDLYKRGLISLGNLNYYDKSIYNINDENNYEFDYLKTNSPIHIDTAPDLHYNLACDIKLYDYERTFISVISETLMDNGTLFITEKTWKPIMVGHPFIILGNKHTLKFLKSLGYKTFDKWIDESYDDIEDEENRRNAIIKILSQLSLLDKQNLFKLRDEMKEVCLYNQRHFYKLYKKKYGEDNINSEISSMIKRIWEELK